MYIEMDAKLLRDTDAFRLQCLVVEMASLKFLMA